MPKKSKIDLAEQERRQKNYYKSVDDNFKSASFWHQHPELIDPNDQAFKSMIGPALKEHHEMHTHFLSKAFPKLPKEIAEHIADYSSSERKQAHGHGLKFHRIKHRTIKKHKK